MFNKEMVGFLALLTLVLIPASSASATMLYYEGFDYTPGLVSTAGTAWSNAYGSSVAPTYDAGSLAYSSLQTTGNHLAQNDPIGSELPYSVNETASTNSVFSQAGTYYITYIGQIQNDVSGLDGLGALVFHSRPTFDQGYVQIGAQANGGNEISFSMEVGGAGGATLVSNGAAVLPGTFMISMRVINDGTAAADDVRMVLNPDLNAGEPDWDSPTLQVTSRDITSDASANGLVYFGRAHEWDEIRVATTWSEAAPTIPEPASLALLSLGGLLIFSRRK